MAAIVSPLPAARCGLLRGVLHAASDHRAVRRAEAVELGVHGGQRLQRPPPGRGGVDHQREAPAHSLVTAARARSAAAAPRSSPRRWVCLSTVWMLACGEQLVADQALGVRLLEIVGIEHQQHVLLDGVPALAGHALGGHQELAGAVEPVQVEQAKAVGVEAVAVGEQEVQAAHRGALHGGGHGAAQGPDRVGAVVAGHEEVEERLRVGVALGPVHVRVVEQPRIAHDRPVVAERVAAQAERVGVVE